MIFKRIKIDWCVFNACVLYRYVSMHGGVARGKGYNLLLPDIIIMHRCSITVLSGHLSLLIYHETWVYSIHDFLQEPF
jgi:hypothetical protein